MADIVNIRDLSSLEQLQFAIISLCDATESSLKAIDSKISYRHENLKKKKWKLESEIEKAHKHLRKSKEKLRYCESRINDDEKDSRIYPDCSSEKYDVHYAEKMLNEANENYDTWKQEVRKVETAISKYDVAKLKFTKRISYEREMGVRALRRLINGAEDYLSTSYTGSLSDSKLTSISDMISKIDPTGIFTASVMFTEIIVEAFFSFCTLGGSIFNIKNKKDKNSVFSCLDENQDCYSKISFEEIGGRKYVKIDSIFIPENLIGEKIGIHLLENIEAIARLNKCDEISTWAELPNVPFYKNQGYEIRDEVAMVGAEVFKKLAYV